MLPIVVRWSTLSLHTLKAPPAQYVPWFFTNVQFTSSVAWRPLAVQATAPP